MMTTNNDRDLDEIIKIADRISEQNPDRGREPIRQVPVRVRVIPTGNPLKGDYGIKVKFTW